MLKIVLTKSNGRDKSILLNVFLVVFCEAMNFSVYAISLFWLRNLLKLFNNVSVVEVGSLNVNGSLRTFLELCYGNRVSMYVGLDISKGPGVDVVSSGYLVDKLFRKKFDIAICTEVLEHVLNPFKLLCSVNGVLKKGGLLVLSTRSPGFPVHCYPEDYWRYTKNSLLFLLKITGFYPLYILYDPQEPGIISLAYKVREPILNISNEAKVDDVIKKYILPSYVYSNIKVSYFNLSTLRGLARSLLVKLLRFVIRICLVILFRIMSVVVFKTLISREVIASPLYRLVLLELLNLYARGNCAIRLVNSTVFVYCLNAKLVISLSELATYIRSLYNSVEGKTTLINRWYNYGVARSKHKLPL